MQTTSTVPHRSTIAMPLFDDQQSAELARVGKKLDPLVLEFFATKQPGSLFHVNELIWFALTREPYITVTSADRTMRKLNQRGQLRYELVARSKSLYRVLALANQEAQ